MRIVSGFLKSRRFKAPSNLPVRPTTDLAKESLFNILKSKMDLDDINVLDLFSGIGSISLEFVSRGAALVHSVDNNSQCLNFIKTTAASLGIENLNAIRYDAFKFPLISKFTYDIIFADPPYDITNIESLPSIILDNTSILNKDGLFILEHSKAYNFSHHPMFLEERKYGKVHFTLFKKA